MKLRMLRMLPCVNAAIACLVLISIGFAFGWNLRPPKIEWKELQLDKIDSTVYREVNGNLAECFRSANETVKIVKEMREPWGYKIIASDIRIKPTYGDQFYCETEVKYQQIKSTASQ